MTDDVVAVDALEVPEPPKADSNTAGTLTPYMANKLLDHITSKVEYDVPALYVGLSVTASVSESATELSGNGYARAAVGTANSAALVGSSYLADNAAEIAFAACSGSNWGVVHQFAIFDASTAGNRLTKWKALTSDQTVNVGGTFKFPAGNLDIAIPS